MRIATATTLACAILVLVVPGALGGGVAVEPQRSLLELGDSLSVGASPYLRQQLRGYRIRSMHSIGLRTPAVTDFVARTGSSLPPVLVVSAGTNDDPRRVSAFARAVSGILAAAGRGRCVVWPTIVRPPVAGATSAGLNRALGRAASRHSSLVLVDWVGLVRRHPGWLRADGVHASAAGYRARAAAIARAVKTRCGS